MSTTPGRDECNYLISLADRLGDSMTDADVRLKAWHDKARELLDSPCLEALQGERELEQLSMQLRSEWLRYANQVSSQYLKSPPTFQVVRAPSGTPNSFPYDRWNEPVLLEQRACSYHPAPAGWHTDHVLFSTGMAAINCMLMVMRTMFQPAAANPLHLHGVGGYFEIMDMMTANHDALFQRQIFNDQEQLQASVSRGASQILYIEPVSCKFSLDVFDLEGFLDAWSQRNADIPTILVLDTTLSGNTFPIEEILTRFSPHKPGIVIQISSTLKLDQEGLEFSNCGLMSIYSFRQENVVDLAFRMRRFRSAMGFGLMLEQISALDYPGFLNREIADRHATAIFANNACLARQLDTGSELLFETISHPVLNGETRCPWAVAPFVYLGLKRGASKEDRELLSYAFLSEAGNRGLLFQPGSSFGFRAHRAEMGGIRDDNGFEIIRVAMGCRTGPGLDKTIELINDISHLGTFENLRNSYPQLVEPARKSLERKKKHASFM